MAEQQFPRYERKQKKHSLDFYILIGIALIIGIAVYNKFNWFQPTFKEKINVTRAGQYVEFDLHLKKAGCYEVGFGSYDFDFRKQSIGGTYKLEYFSDGKLIQEKTISKRDVIGATSYTATNYISATIDMGSILNHTDIKARLTVIEPYKTKDTFYFYATDTHKKDTCYVFATLNVMFLRDAIWAMTIDTNETNKTLKELSSALWQKNTNKIKELIPNQFDANVNMVANHKPLHYAAYLNDVETIRYLINSGADIDPQDIQKSTPLHYAVAGNSLDSVKLLMDMGADPEKAKFISSTSLTPDYKSVPIFFASACKGYYDLTSYLLQSPKIDKNMNNIYSSYGFYELPGYLKNHCTSTNQDKIDEINKLLKAYEMQEFARLYKERKANQTKTLKE
jgi:hypothetical protein